MPPLLSVVSPVYCEEECIEEFHRRLTAVLDGLPHLDHEIIYVDDGSTDRSPELLRQLASDDPRVRVVRFSRNFGHQQAITAGIDHARGGAVVLVDSDLQDPPEVIPQMVDRWEKGFKVVYGLRTHREGETRFKVWTSRLYYRLARWLSDVDLPPDAGDFRLLDRNVVDVLAAMPERNRYLRGMVAWAGFPQSPVEYERDARHAGTTKYSMRRMLRLALDGITSFSDRPLRLATQLGVVATMVALLFMVWIIVASLIDPAESIRGWPSIMAAVLFVGGVQLLSIGVLGTYIGRVYRESKGRPLYVVEDLVNIERPTPGDARQ